MSCKIRYEDVSFTYADGTRALRRVSFVIGHGERVALLGPNGAGKSTIMLLSNGILMPQEGSIMIGSLKLSPKTLVPIRQRVGLVFQDPDDQLFMTTVFDDVAFGLLNQGIKPDDGLKERVADALQTVGLEHLARKAPQDLSFGQKKRAALATILAMRPDFLILDEPSSNLDPRGRRHMIKLLQEMEHTVLLATHDLDMVWETCPRSIIIDEGLIVADGPTRELLRDEQLLEAHGLELPAAARCPAAAARCPAAATWCPAAAARCPAAAT